MTFSSPVLEKAKHAKRGTSGEEDSYSKENEAAMKAFYAAAKKHFKGTGVRVVYEEGDVQEDTGDKWGNDIITIKYPDGWSFVVSMDERCLEIQPHYYTLPWLRKKENQERIQRDIFDLMASVGLTPHRLEGGGHDHVGFYSLFADNENYTQKDVAFVWNILADQANHFEVSWGGMENDQPGAQTLFTLLDKEQKRRFEAFRDRVISGELKKPRDLVSAFVADVFLKGQKLTKKNTGRLLRPFRYASLNVLRTADLDTPWGYPYESWDGYAIYIMCETIEKEIERTFEFRDRHAPLNVTEVLQDSELVAGRLEYLERLEEPLSLSREFLAAKKPAVTWMAGRFFDYLVESGVKPGDFVGRLPKEGDKIKNWQGWRRVFAQRDAGCAAAIEALGRNGN